MTLRTTLTAALTSLALTATGALAQEYADYGTTKGWAVLSVSDGGSFLRCEAMKDRVIYMITYSSEGWMVTIDSLPGAPSEVAGFIDIDRASFETVFYALDDGRYGAFLDPGAAEALKQGSYIRLDAGGQITEGPLDGSAAAMGKLADAWKTAGCPPPRPARRTRQEAGQETPAGGKRRGTDGCHLPRPARLCLCPLGRTGDG